MAAMNLRVTYFGTWSPHCDEDQGDEDDDQDDEDTDQDQNYDKKNYLLSPPLVKGGKIVSYICNFSR